MSLHPRRSIAKLEKVMGKAPTSISEEAARLLFADDAVGRKLATASKPQKRDWRKPL